LEKYSAIQCSGFFIENNFNTHIPEKTRNMKAVKNILVLNKTIDKIRLDKASAIQVLSK
jgi:hypothetical protein